MNSSLIDKTLDAVQKDIAALRTKRGNLMNSSQFEKDKKPHFVLRTCYVHEIARNRFRVLKNLDKSEVLSACESLLSLQLSETNTVAIDWAVFLRKQYDPKDFARFHRWLKAYVPGWGMCDSLCCGPLGMLLCDFPELAPKTQAWVGSRNLWLRRASAVALIPSVRKKKSFDLALKISESLLLDSEDYVQKGYGWLLKEASREYQEEIFNFVMQRKDRMPRTALRYAIEKMPLSLRREAMRRD